MILVTMQAMWVRAGRAHMPGQEGGRMVRGMEVRVRRVVGVGVGG